MAGLSPTMRGNTVASQTLLTEVGAGGTASAMASDAPAGNGSHLASIDPSSLMRSGLDR